MLCNLIGSKAMVKITTRSYLLYGAALGALIIILIALFLNSSDNSLFLLGQNNNKQQSNGQEGEDDEYYLRGAVNSTSREGKQVVEKYEKHLCGGGTPSEKNPEFIQEYSIPVIACSQPVGIAVDDNNDKIWIAATWVGYLVVFDPDLKRFVDFIEIPNWRTKGIFGSMV
ncbi:MAG TPA: hypothetical protein VE445_02355, partial [Nitrososphaeraceae archaeon]|nr:hypothetical protein [Nitrososphaeraceae archaeon]